MSGHKNPLLWVDIETPGLGMDEPLLEIAAIFTDWQLEPLSNMFVDVGFFDRDVREIDPYVLQMHDASGLWRECLAADPLHGTRQVLGGFEQWIGDNGFDMGFTLAGSGISHFDAPWLDHHCPKVEQRRTYFSEDIGATRRLFRPVGVVWPGTPDEIAHRAVDDIESHLNEARWYQRIAAEWLREQEV
jgi:oligoribonuclease (3'-5' exoribonuclease)